MNGPISVLRAAAHAARRGSATLAALTSAGAVVAVVMLAAQQQAAGLFTTEQAVAGQAAYQERCASCHLPDLGGRGEAPPLAGANFLGTWGSRSTRDLFSYISTTMPPTGASLSEVNSMLPLAFAACTTGAMLDASRTLTAIALTP